METSCSKPCWNIGQDLCQLMMRTMATGMTVVDSREEETHIFQCRVTRQLFSGKIFLSFNKKKIYIYINLSRSSCWCDRSKMKIWKIDEISVKSAEELCTDCSFVTPLVRLRAYYWRKQFLLGWLISSYTRICLNSSECRSTYYPIPARASRV